MKEKSNIENPSKPTIGTQAEQEKNISDIKAKLDTAAKQLANEDISITGPEPERGDSSEVMLKAGYQFTHYGDHAYFRLKILFNKDNKSEIYYNGIIRHSAKGIMSETSVAHLLHQVNFNLTRRGLKSFSDKDALLNQDKQLLLKKADWATAEKIVLDEIEEQKKYSK